MIDLGINQIVGFYYWNVWKVPVEEWHFKHFGSKNQLPGF